LGGQPEVTLAEYKRQLRARSEVHRQAAGLELQQIAQSLSWIPKTTATARKFMPLLGLALPLAGFVFVRKAFKSSSPRTAPAPAKKRGLLAAILVGIETYNKVRPLLATFTQARARTRSRAQSEDASPRFDRR
jgi:hypothetical protein